MQLLDLSPEEIAAMKKLGKVILASYRKEPVRQPEPSPREFELIADVFLRIEEL
jgi:hypothetical protein